MVRFITLAVLAMRLGAGELTSAEARGKQIFLKGTNNSRTPVTASFGGDGNELPGASFACANCHRADGRGKPEGDVVPSDIRWSELTKPYGLAREDGRRRPPYTDRLLKRAITLGLDPAGQVLGTAMPRFHMAWQDLDDLVTYLKRLEEDGDPGVSAGSVRIGVMVPAAAALDEFAAGINREGGIFGRAVELRYANRAEAAQDFIRREKPFAIVARGPVPEPDQTPIVGALPVSGSAFDRYVFSLDAGLDAEIESLAEWASRKGVRGTAWIVGGSSGNALQRHGWKDVRIWSAGMRAGSGDVVLVLNADALKRMDLSSRPLLLIPGSVPAADAMRLPGASEGRVALAWPWPEEAALASLKLLVEGLKRTGRELTRDGLVDSLEKLDKFRAGVGPPIGFSPGERIGSRQNPIFLASPQTHSFILQN